MIRAFPLILFLTTGLTSPAFAVDRVHFVGQFGQKALLEIDGRRRIVGVGQTSPEGVRVLSVDSASAVVDYDDAKRTLGFGTRIDGDYKPSQKSEARITMDADGSFRTTGTINGQLVDVMLDTGASSVAMNELTARKLGIDFRYTGRPITVSTASGLTSAYRVRLRSVRVGEIEVRDIEGSVIEGGFPEVVLLGMSFLNSVDMTRKGKVLVLEKTH
jgi:aspartyl protease family protein